MTTRNPDDLQSASGAPTPCADDTKRPYQTPCLTCNGKLEKVTLAYTFAADGVCVTPGQTFATDPDCF